MTWDDFLQHFDNVKLKGGTTAQMQCPVHEDRVASLSAKLDSERILLHCHAGCDNDEILVAAGLDWKDLAPEKRERQFVPATVPTRKRMGNRTNDISRDSTMAHYQYCTADGDIAYRVVRSVEKNFQIESCRDDRYAPGLNGTEPVPYRFPELLQAIADDRWVFWVEGEKCVETLRSAGLQASTTHGGAAGFKNLLPELTHLSGIKVALVPDQDIPGFQYMDNIRDLLLPIAKDIRYIELPGLQPKEDVVEYLERNSIEDLKQLVMQASNLALPSLTFLSDVEYETIDWLFPQYIPKGQLTTITGNGGVGKSTIAVEVAAAATGTANWPNDVHNARPTSVLLCPNEDSPSMIRRKCEAAGADLTRIGILNRYVDGTQLQCDNSTHMAWLQQQIQKSGSELVIFDPILAFTKPGFSANNASDTHAVLDPLCRIAETLNIAIILIAHWSKMQSGNASDKMAGSRAWIDTCRMNYAVATHPEDRDLPDKTERRQVMAVSKTNLPQPESLMYRLKSWENDLEVPKIEWCGTTEVTADQLTIYQPPELPDEQAEIDAILSRLLSAESMQAVDIYKELHAQGFSRDQVKRSRRRLAIETTFVEERNGWYWILPGKAYS